MARLNDNLFTTLVEHTAPQELGCLMWTRLGCLRIRFTQAGLAELVFEESRMERRRECSFRELFLQWLRIYQQLSAEEQWSYLDLTGTDFQKSVWRALLEIPFGERTSYGQMAAALGRPKASRAVGSAVGANPVSLLVPCHRVLPSSGQIGNYRWGADRKRALLDAEQESGSDLSSLFQ